jgi:hypothetical protein
MGLRPLVHTPLLSINVEKPWVATMIEKLTVILLLDSGAPFSDLLFSPGPQSNDKFIIWGISGQPLECYFTQPLACSWGDLHFCHPFLIVPDTPGPLLWQDLLSKGSNSLAPRQLYLLLPPSGTNRSHSVDSWDDCRVSQNGPPYSNKTQRSFTVSTPRTVSPQV